MFEAALKAKLEKIFEVREVTFDDPGESLEQETLFVQINSAYGAVTDGKYRAHVKGQALIYAQGDKLPFGFFSKKVAAHPDLTKDLFFYGMDENTKLYGNIVQRGFSFEYFFSSQYDPAIGTITSVITEVEVNS